MNSLVTPRNSAAIFGDQICPGAWRGQGVGELLTVQDSILTKQSYGVINDANGNVTQLVKGIDGTLSANYQYSPFGEVLEQSGEYATNNPFKFSSKFEDRETANLYLGLRYYCPSSGRWLSRDFLEEQRGVNMYEFVSNNGLMRIESATREFQTAAGSTCRVSHLM